MKTLGKIIHKLAGMFYAIQRYLDNHEPFNDARWFVEKIGKKIYPKGYCSGCGLWLELCYDGRKPRDENTIFSCCECGRIPEPIVRDNPEVDK